MHINLFLSLALNNTSWLVWYKFVLFDVRQAELTASNGYCLLSPIHATSIKENANFVVYARVLQCLVQQRGLVPSPPRARHLLHAVHLLLDAL